MVAFSSLLQASLCERRRRVVPFGAGVVGGAVAGVAAGRPGLPRGGPGPACRRHAGAHAGQVGQKGSTVICPRAAKYK